VISSIPARIKTVFLENIERLMNHDFLEKVEIVKSFSGP